MVLGFAAAVSNDAAAAGSMHGDQQTQIRCDPRTEAGALTFGHTKRMSSLNRFAMRPLYLLIVFAVALLCAYGAWSAAGWLA
jgi:hypothetical protein